MYCDWCIAPSHVGGIPHANLGEEDPYNKLFQQNGTPLHFHIAVQNLLHWKFPWKWIGWWHYQLTTSFPWPYTMSFLLLGAHKRCCLYTTTAHHFARTFCWELADVPSFTVLKTQICVTRPQCVNAVAEEFLRKFSCWCFFFFCIRDCKFTLDALLC